MLLADRSASLKWSGDFSLQRFRAKLANQYLLHPDVAPGYDELYRSDLGERTIARRDHASSLSDFAYTLRSNATSPASPLAATGLTALGRSASGANLTMALGKDSSTSSLPTLGQSSSVPTLGLRRMESQPAAVRLGRTVEMEKMKGKETVPTSPMSPEERKEREKELNSEAMSRRLWAAAHGGEVHLKEFIQDRNNEVIDPSTSIKTCACPGITKALKGGAKLDWKNDEWDGCTLLLKAIRTNAEALAEYLLAIGADPLVVDKSGRGVFHWAAIEGNPSVMNLLLNNIPEPPLQVPDNGGDTPLHLAAYHGHLPIIRQLTREKTDDSKFLEQTNALGFTALDLAEARRMWHIVHYLSESKFQEEDKTCETKDFQVRNLVRPCNLGRANELKSIADLNPKPKAKGAAKKK